MRLYQIAKMLDWFWQALIIIAVVIGVITVVGFQNETKQMLIGIVLVLGSGAAFINGIYEALLLVSRVFK